MSSLRSKVLSIEDHELFRDGLRRALAEIDPPVEVLEAGTFAGGLEQIAGHETDLSLVLLDLHLPDATGLGMLRRLRDDFPLLPVAIVSGESSEPRVMRQALDLGAVGFLPKSSSRAVLVSALRLVLSGGTYAPPEAMSAPPDLRAERVAGLTPRQREVGELLAKGLTNKEIARVLGISADTVKNHVAAILDVLDVTNRTEAVMTLVETGALGTTKAP